MNRFGGNLGQGLLGNPPMSSNFSPHDQNMFLGGDNSYGGNQESYIGDGGGYARDLGDSGGRMGGGKDGGYFQDTDIRGNSYREQMNGSDRYGDGGNLRDRRVSGDRDYRNEEDFYSGANTMSGGRQDRLSGGGNFGDGRGRGVAQDHFSRQGVGSLSPSVLNKGQGILGSGPIVGGVGGDTDFRTQGGYGGMGSHSRAGNIQSAGNLGFSPPNMGNQGIRQQGGGPGLQMAGMEANLLSLQKQQQQQEAMLRDTQLQMVNNLLLQQQQNKRGTGNQLNPGFGGQSLLGTPQNLPSGLMRSPGGNQRSTSHIPSLLDINTQKPQGKRGFTGPRDQGGFKRQRMTAQKRTPDRRYDNNSNRGPRRHSPDRQRSSEGKDSRSSTPRRKESDGARNTPARGQSMSQHTNTGKQSTSDMQQQNTETTPQVTPKAKPSQTDLTEKYDPEEPTEDEVMDYEEDRETIRVLDIAEEPNPSCILEQVENIEDITVVTVEKESEESDEKSKERVHSTKKVTNFFCHVCNTECRDPEGFAKHMNGMKHRNRMESMMGLHLEKSNQLISRIKAEEHLRKIESSPRDEDRRRNDGERRRSREGWDRQSGNNFQRHFSGPFRRRGAFHQSDSRSRRERRQSSDQEIFPDIGDLVTLDTVGFEDDTDRDMTSNKSPLKSRHREKPSSDQTSSNVEIIVLDDASDDEKKVSKRKKSNTPLVSSDNKERLQADAEVKKSVNGNSSKTDEAAKTASSNTSKESSSSTPSKPSDKDENPKDTTDTTPMEMTSTSLSKQSKDASVREGKETAKEASSTTPTENLAADLPEKPLVTPSTQDKKESPAPKVKTDSLTEGIPPYNPELPVGQNYIVAVTGFYCKLCSKFYNNEKAARESHCQSRAHYDKFKSAMTGSASLSTNTAKDGVPEGQSAAESEVMKEDSRASEEGPKSNSPGKRGRAGSQANRGQRGRKGRK